MEVFSFILKVQSSSHAFVSWIEWPHTHTGGGPVYTHTVKQTMERQRGTRIAVRSTNHSEAGCDGGAIISQKKFVLFLMHIFTLLCSYTHTHTHSHMHTVLSCHSSQCGDILNGGNESVPMDVHACPSLSKSTHVLCRDKEI
jgi:hypothetical protein